MKDNFVRDVEIKSTEWEEQDMKDFKLKLDLLKDNSYVMHGFKPELWSASMEKIGIGRYKMKKILYPRGKE